VAPLARRSVHTFPRHAHRRYPLSRLPLPLRAKGPDIRMPNLRYHDQGVAAMEFLPALADGTPLLVSAGVATEGERACRRLHCACSSFTCNINININDLNLD